jgi:hypothetical protein
MQVVINIDDAIYNRAMVYKGEQFPDNDDLLGALITAVNNGTPIPKGATNGDAIKAMFPGCKDWKVKIEGDDWKVHFVQLPNSMTTNKYEESFWNAPYK